MARTRRLGRRAVAATAVGARRRAPAAAARGGRRGRAPDVDQHTLMVRRRVAAGAAVVLLIVIVLRRQRLPEKREAAGAEGLQPRVSALAHESNEQVSQPLFAALSGAAGKSALDVEVQVDQLRIQAQNQASQAKSLSVPAKCRSAAQPAAHLRPARRRDRRRSPRCCPRRWAARTSRRSNTDRRRHGDLPRPPTCSTRSASRR